MHVDKALEAVLLARVEQPVNRALLVHLAVVGVEVLQEVAADDVARGLALSAEGVSDEAQVLLERLLAVGGADEADGEPDDVVVEVLVVGNGQDTVVVGYEAGLGDTGQVVGHGGALVGQDEPVLVERVAAHHAADGV